MRLLTYIDKIMKGKKISEEKNIKQKMGGKEW